MLTLALACHPSPDADTDPSTSNVDTADEDGHAHEADDLRVGATALDGPASASIADPLDTDWWRVDAAGPGFVRARVEASRSAPPLMATLVDADGVPLADRAVLWGDLVAWLPAAGAYAIEVRPWDDHADEVTAAGVPYTIEASFEDAFAEPDAPDAPGGTITAGALGVRLEDATDVDWIRLDHAGPTFAFVGMGGAATDTLRPTLSVYRADGVLWARGSQASFPMPTSPMIVGVAGTAAGWNALRVSDSAWSATSEAEPNDAAPQAVPMESGASWARATVYGVLAAGDADRFTIEVPMEGRLFVDTAQRSPGLVGLDVQVTDAAGHDAGEDVGAGAWDVRVSATGGQGEAAWYLVSLMVDATPTD